MEITTEKAFRKKEKRRTNVASEQDSSHHSGHWLNTLWKELVTTCQRSWYNHRWDAQTLSSNETYSLVKTRHRKAPENHSLHRFSIKLITRTREASHVPPYSAQIKPVITENRMWNYTDHQPAVSDVPPSWVISRVRGESGKHHWVSDLNRPVLGGFPLRLTHSFTKVEENTSLLKCTLTYCTSLTHWLRLWRRRGHVQLS